MAKMSKRVRVFKEKVVDYFIQSYKEGITPNPCIECNRNIKFGVFLENIDKKAGYYVGLGATFKKFEFGLRTASLPVDNIQFTASFRFK